MTTKTIKSINPLQLRRRITLSVFCLLMLFQQCSQKNTPPEESADSGQHKRILPTSILRNHVSYFNQMEEEEVTNLISNREATDWLINEVPLFECPDSTLEETYYFRWWTYRKHLKSTPEGYVFTEFITPVKHDGKYNTISCALGHQVYEGRWLENNKYLDDYIVFWLIRDHFENSKRAHNFSSWLADAVYQRYLVNHDETFVISLLDELDRDYTQWEQERQNDDGLFWQFDVKDGMEESISGSRRDRNPRPTINSYMFANARAIARMAELVGNETLQQKFVGKADTLKTLIQQKLWDPDGQFFKVLFEKGGWSSAREEIGYIPWYFDLPDDNQTFGRAWEQMKDSSGFAAPYGITTAEQRHPEFRTHGVGGCEWDGAVWPFATTQTLKGLANLINDYQHHPMTREDYFGALQTYARSQSRNGHPYIGEYQDEQTGAWLKGNNPRSRYYNHSGFCDLIINDLVGLKPQLENKVVVQPLVPKNKWDWFCLDQVSYHGKKVTIVWDKTGEKYHKGKGLSIWVDGIEIGRSAELEKITAPLPDQTI